MLFDFPVRRLAGLVQVGTLLLCAPAALSQSAYVSPAGSDSAGDGSIGSPYATIQYAIDVMPDGAEVRLLAGIYTGPGNRDLDLLGKNLRLLGDESMPGTCTIDCEGSAEDPHFALWVHSGETTDSEMRGITVTGAYVAAPAFAAVMIGGGPTPPVGAHGAALRIVGCDLTANHGPGIGLGDADSLQMCRVDIDSCEVVGNEGPGIMAVGLAEVTVDIQRLVVAGNAGDGLAIDPQVVSATLVARDLTSAENLGDGIRAASVRERSVNLESGTASGNGGQGLTLSGQVRMMGVATRDNSGVGLLVGSLDQRLSLLGSDVQAVDNGSVGVKLAASSADVNLAGFVISGNHGEGCRYEVSEASRLVVDNLLVANNQASGLSLISDEASGFQEITLLRSTLVANLADGISLDLRSPSGDFFLEDLLVVGNEGAAINVSAGVPTHPIIMTCNCFGNAGGDWVGSVEAIGESGGNFSLPPLFCDAAAGDFALSDASPCMPDVWPFINRIGALTGNCGFDGVAHVAVSGSDVFGNGSGSSPLATLRAACVIGSGAVEVELADGQYAGSGFAGIHVTDRPFTLRSAGGDPGACSVDLGGQPGITVEYSVPELGRIGLHGVSFEDGLFGVEVVSAYSFAGQMLDCQVQDCAFRSCGTGLRAETAILRISDSRVADCQGSGVDFGMGALYMSRCRVVRNGIGAAGYSFDYRGSRIDSTEFVGNGIGFDGSSGIKQSGPKITGQIDFVDCRVDSSLGDGVRASGACSGGLVLTNCMVRGNGGHGVTAYGDLSLFEVNGGVIGDNLGDGVHVISSCGTVDLNGVTIQGSGGWGLFEAGSWLATAAIADCTVVGNALGGVTFEDGRLSIVRVVLAENQGPGLVRSAAGMGEFVELTGSTIANNQGDGVRVERGAVAVAHCIIAANSGSGLELGGGGPHAVECTDSFGNAVADWSGEAMVFAGANGNISLDPQFCSAPAGGDADYTIDSRSPCSELQSGGCGLFGARGVGCWSEPVILSVLDVPADQGGQIRLTWAASSHDAPGSLPVVTGYGVYRRQDMASGRDGVRADAKLLGWDFLLSVPARQDPGYQVVVPTLCDSTILRGLCESVYLVSAMTFEPGTYYDSDPAVGYSVDNLAPGAPVALVAEYRADGMYLAWDARTESDLLGYRVYRIEHAPGPPDTTAYQLTVASWHDVDPEAAERPQDFLYEVVAVDRSGNESARAAFGAVADVGDAVQSKVFLAGAAPNPFNALTRIQYRLPAAGPVTLDVFDIAGRYIVTLVDDSNAPAGPGFARWDGLDGGGRACPAGVYFAVLSSGRARLVERMVLLK